MRGKDEDCYGLMALKQNKNNRAKHNQIKEQNQLTPLKQVSSPQEPCPPVSSQLKETDRNSQIIRIAGEGRGKSTKKWGEKQECVQKNKGRSKIGRRKPEKQGEKKRHFSQNKLVKSCSLKEKLSDIEQTQEQDSMELKEKYIQNQLKIGRVSADFLKVPPQLAKTKRRAEKRINSCIKFYNKKGSESRPRETRYTY